MTGLGYLSLPLTIIGVIGLAVTVLKAFTTLSGSWLLLTSISLAACAGGGAGMWLKQRSFRVEAQVSSDNQVRLMVVNTGRRSEFAADVESLTASPDPLKTDVVWGLPWEGYGGGAVREILTDSRRSLLLARVDLRQPNQDSPLNRRGKPVGVVHFNNVGGASPSIFLNDDDAPPGSDFSELVVTVRVFRTSPPAHQDCRLRLALEPGTLDRAGRAVVTAIRLIRDDRAHRAAQRVPPSSQRAMASP